MLTNHSLYPVPEPAPPRLWKQGLAAMLGLVLVVVGACFEYWFSPVAAFVAMGAGFFVANLLLSLSKSQPFAEKVTLVAAMHFALFCLLLASDINGLVPLIIITSVCSFLGIAVASVMGRLGKGQLGSRTA